MCRVEDVLGTGITIAANLTMAKAGEPTVNFLTPSFHTHYLSKVQLHLDADIVQLHLHSDME